MEAASDVSARASLSIMRVRISLGSTNRQRPREPVTFGVPLPKGRVREVGEWSIDGRPVDVAVLDRWGDGTVRWMLVDGQVDVGPTPREASLSDTPATEAVRALVVDETAGAVIVDTGVIRVGLQPGGGFPFASVESNGTPVASAATTGLAIEGESGGSVRVTTRGVHVEHAGRLRACVRVDADATIGGTRRVEFIARVEFFAGHGSVRVRITVRNPDRAVHPGNYWDLGDPGSILIRDCTLTIARPEEAAAAAEVSLEAGQPATRVALPFELYQDSSGGEYWNSTNHINRNRVVPNTFRGYRARAGNETTSGLRATPIVTVGDGAGAVTVALPGFWQNFPRAVEADTRSLDVRFFPRQYADLHELQGGEQKTHECFVAFGPDQAGAGYEWCRSRADVVVDPAWVLATGAVDGLAPLDAGHRALVDQAIDGPDTFEQKREIVDQYGWRHFGDIYGDHEAIGHTGPAPLTSHYNNQYDPILGFALQFLRTGDARWRTAMDELATHVVDIDIYHTTRDKSAYNGGLFWHTYHYGDADTSTHRTYPKRNTGKVFGGGPSADHNYPSGLVLRYFLTGDASAREAAVGLAEYVLNLEDWRQTPFRFLSRADTGRAIYTPPGYYGPSRSSGNSLNALVDGHRLTGDARFIEKADLLVRRVVHPDEDPGRNRLDEPEYRWFYAMFLQSLGKYLIHKAECGMLDAAYAHGRASLLTYARWMAVHEYPYLEKPEKLEFPTETWAAQDIRKSDIFCHAAMHAAGEERERFVERASFFHRTSVETLQGMPTRSLARPVIVLLTSGLWHAWTTAHPGTELPPGPAIEFGRPEAFVGQRAIAEQRAKILAGVGLVVCLVAVAALAVWMF